MHGPRGGFRLIIPVEFRGAFAREGFREVRCLADGRFDSARLAGFFAQCVGAKDIAEAKRVVGTAAVFFLGLSLFMSLAGFALTQRSLRQLATPPDALPLALARTTPVPSV